MSSDIQELEASLRQQEVVREQETPAEEIARLKESSQAEHFNVDREVRRSSRPSFSSACCLMQIITQRAKSVTGKQFLFCLLQNVTFCGFDC